MASLCHLKEKMEIKVELNMKKCAEGALGVTNWEIPWLLQRCKKN